MPVTVIAEFHAAPGKLDELLATLKAVLPETRAYDGCLGLDSWLDQDRSTIVLTEQWDSFDHYDRYLAWRAETGVLAAAAGLLEGGAAGFVPRKCVPAGC